MRLTFVGGYGSVLLFQKADEKGTGVQVPDISRCCDLRHLLQVFGTKPLD